jgi:predicted CXXCH cytochrome family protein
MKRLLWISVALLLATLGLPAWLQAEQMLHHGLMVEADSPAQGCLGCHDGVSAKHVSFCTVQCDFSSPHSLMKPYPPAGREARYAPASVIVAKGIKLENGRVTCNSCHDLRKPSAGHLIMENTRSKLCLTCHIRM